MKPKIKVLNEKGYASLDMAEVQSISFFQLSNCCSLTINHKERWGHKCYVLNVIMDSINESVRIELCKEIDDKIELLIAIELINISQNLVDLLGNSSTFSSMETNEQEILFVPIREKSSTAGLLITSTNDT